jgi:hypothetical protein
MLSLCRNLALALAGAFMLALCPAQAQTARVVTDCTVTTTLTSRDGTNLMVDQFGRLCTAGGGSASTGSVTSPGASGTQAQNVQGIAGGVPQNSYPCQYNATLPTLTTGASAYASCDVNGRLFALLPTGSTITPLPNTSGSVSVTPVTTTGSSLVGKASGGNLYGYHATFSATAGYVAILNAATAPAAGAAISPIECTPIAANSSYRTRQDFPDRYPTGVVLLATSSCTTYTAVTPVLMTALVL